MNIELPARIQVSSYDEFLRIKDEIEEYCNHEFPGPEWSYFERYCKSCTLSIYLGRGPVDSYYIETSWYDNHPGNEYTIKALNANQYTYDDFSVETKSLGEIFDLFENCLEV